MKEKESEEVDQFIGLIKYFKDFDTEKISNTLKLGNVLNTDFSKKCWSDISSLIPSNCKTIFDCIENIPYDDDAKVLHNKMGKFHLLIENNSVTKVKEEFLNYLQHFQTALDKFVNETKNPSIAVVAVGNIILRLKELGKVPLSLFWAAVDGLRRDNNSKEKKAFYRRVAMITLCGGIPVNLLDSQDDFEYKSENFESIGLPIGDFSLAETSQFGPITELFKSLNEEMDKNIEFSEASLRMLFWDPVFAKYFVDNSADSKLWAIRSEVVLNTFLDLDCERRADLAVFDTKFGQLILFCEVSEEKFSNNLNHKDFAKINSLLTISCIRLAETLASYGLDPTLARTFGVLKGDSCFQFAVAHPVITSSRSTETEGKESEIRVDISTHPHWFSNFNGNDSLTCNGSCCMRNDLQPIKAPGANIKTREGSKEILEHLMKTDLEEVDEVEAEATNVKEGSAEEATQRVLFKESDQLDESCAMEVDPDERDYLAELQNAPVINETSLKKLSIFIKVVKDYIKKLSELRKDASKQVPRFKKPNLSYVPVASRGTNKDTPAGKQLRSVIPRTDAGIVSSSSNCFASGKVNLKEADLYKQKLNGFFCYPRTFDSWEISPGDYNMKFEKMAPLIGDGFYGPHGRLFGPQIRSAAPIHFILDACTFAVHALYGLYILHEMVGYVHGDISPENIMFSPRDDIWKLNDFGSAFPVEESLETARECGTQDFIAPESLKTGIFTKSSDVYALGQVLWRLFHIQIMWNCLEEQEDKVEAAYEAFFEAAKAMINDSPAERPSVISCMECFNQIIKNNPINNFRIYGSDKLMISVDQLLEKVPKDENSFVDLPFTKIVTNIL